MARELPIVRTDFPAARRGWDPEAVQAHLRDVEAEVTDLRRAASAGSASETASAQVREIVAAAERTAESIRAAAEADAQAIRADAIQDAERAREAARRVGERADELERELAALGEGLRAVVDPRDAAPEPPPAEPAPAPEGAEALPEAPDAEVDEEEVRFVALDLALSGRTREEVEQDLAERYGPADRNSILDDVFSTVEG